jgi:hypothetical protein
MNKNESGMDRLLTQCNLMYFQTSHIYGWNRTVHWFQYILHEDDTVLRLTNIYELAYCS